MAALVTNPRNNENELYVIHPLDDVQEQKRSSEGLGLIELSPTVRWSLRVLRVYLIAMTGVLLYRVGELTQIIGHHAR